MKTTLLENILSWILLHTAIITSRMLNMLDSAVYYIKATFFSTVVLALGLVLLIIGVIADSVISLGDYLKVQRR